MGSEIRIEIGNLSDPKVHQLIDELSAVLAGITGRDGRNSFAAGDMLASRSVFLVTYLGDRAVACGAIRPLSDEVCEIKRMYASEKGKGLGTALLRELENQAANFGYKSLWLETGVQNSGAIGFYTKNGYLVRENYGKYQGRPECVCFEKALKC